ncbi:DNA cytosine methyltransferase [Devosia sp. 1635]|uniref:DNA cytosine methyltransferase n=1 Tax=Devosia sp. 1635 TaxID=2726066 RepID=UPI001564297B|nr:DNA cytosine methyltransferase [Devosia sp. 1635]
MRYGSVCSGIEAATMAWHPLGWVPAFFSEIENFPSAVLAHHYGSNLPGEADAKNGVPNHGDMTKFQEWPDHAIDLLVGGTPCQSFSVAGLRAGLADPRGNLMLTYLAIAARYRPRWLVWENVPGVLSSNDGRDFGTFLGALGELGYGFAYRVLDAQYCRAHGYERAVPQRRRRVFVVGYLGDWRRAAAVLFNGESLRGNPAPGRGKGQAVAALTSNGVGTCGADDNQAQAGHFVADVSRALTACKTATGRLDPNEQEFVAEVAATLDASYGRLQGASGQDAYHGHSQLVAFDTTQITSKTNISHPKSGNPCHPLAAGAHPPAVAWSIMPQNSGKDYKARPVDVAQPIMANGPVGGNQGGDYIQEAWEVRRLTPRECERLQGFPDDFTKVPYRGKPAADGPRYKALGNSMAVNVMRVLGDRIAMVDAL